MKNNQNSFIFKFLVAILSVSLLFLLWEFVARAINKPAFIPTFSSTANAFFTLIKTFSFWKTVLTSLYRIFLGLLMGVFIGIVLAITSAQVPILRSLVSAVMGIIKATPVASIIIIIWILVGSENVPTAIALFMVSPIVWQATVQGLNSSNKDMDEVAMVFRLSFTKKLKHIVIPRVTKHFIPALLTSVGFAWKSGIAAEIISVTKDSIGYHIKNTKDSFDAEYMFAWTGTVVLISLIFEAVVKFVARRVKCNVTN